MTNGRLFDGDDGGPWVFGVGGGGRVAGDDGEEELGIGVSLVEMEEDADMLASDT